MLCSTHHCQKGLNLIVFASEIRAFSSNQAESFKALGGGLCPGILLNYSLETLNPAPENGAGVQRSGMPRSAAQVRRRVTPHPELLPLFSFIITLGIEMSDTKVYQP